MSGFRNGFDRFNRRLVLREAASAAMIALIVAAVIVAAAPWLRSWIGLPGFFGSLLLPLLAPLLAASFRFYKAPGRRAAAMAADRWLGANGSIVSAFEISQAGAKNPFASPVLTRAAELLEKATPPVPGWFRRAVAIMVVAIAMIPLSRWIEAQGLDSALARMSEQASQKTEVDPEEAEKLADDAASAAQQAEELGAEAQKNLAEDIEDAARRVQAGPSDKEHALRNANNLKERAQTQMAAAERREAARSALAQNPATTGLAKALESGDQRAVEQAADELAKSVFKNDGRIDAEKAGEIRRAVREARVEAPGDPQLRRAAEALEKALDPAAIERTQADRKRIESEMKLDGKAPEAIEKALEAAAALDAESLKKAMEKVAEAASLLRDLDPSGEMAKKLNLGGMSPEQLREMREKAMDLLKRLDLDAEALKKMLQQGEGFKGLEELGREMARRGGTAGEGDEAPGGDGVPDWAKESFKPGQDGGGAPGGDDGAAGGDENNGTRNTDSKTENETGGGINGKETGINVNDTGERIRDPDGKEIELDPDKAGDETATRNLSGKVAKDGRINTHDEIDNLPRRFRKAAGKYFNR